MNEPTVTAPQLFAEIGRMHVEIQMLKAKLSAALEAQQVSDPPKEDKPNG